MPFCADFLASQGDPIPARLDDLNLVQRERILRYMVMRMAELPINADKGARLQSLAEHSSGGRGGGGLQGAPCYLR